MCGVYINRKQQVLCNFFSGLPFCWYETSEVGVQLHYAGWVGIDSVVQDIFSNLCYTAQQAGSRNVNLPRDIVVVLLQASGVCT